MTEENKKQDIEGKKEERKIAEAEKVKEKEEAKKKEEEKIKTKLEKKEAVAFGKDLPISTKHAVAICNFIRGKRIEKAIFLLEEVINKKLAVPMKGELPHRKGKIMSGRYPIKASQQFIKLLKQLAANAIVNEIEVEKGTIECKADKASRPYRRFGNTRFKRTHVMLKLKSREKIGEEKKK